MSGKFEFKSISAKEFDKFSNSHPLSTFFQTSAMSEVSKTNGWDSEYLGVFKDSKLIAATRLTSRKNHGKVYYYAIRGPLLDYSDTKLLEFFINELKNYCKKNGGYELKIDPIVQYEEHDQNGDIVPGKNNSKIIEKLKALGFKHGGFTVGVPKRSQVRWASVLDFTDVLSSKELSLATKTREGLEQAKEKLLASFKQNHRNLIRRTIKTGIVVEELEKKDLQTYLDIVHSTGERRGFAVQDKKYFESFFDNFVVNEKAKFLVAYLVEGKKKTPISTALFVMNRDEILYFTSGGYEEYMKYYGQYAVQWSIMCWGLAHGYKKLNFYGISGIFDPHDPSYGVFQFKKGFGAKVEEYIGDFYMPLSFYYYIDKAIAKLKGIKK
ncbi:MAG: peptidoglycan bridge formation glycyltransferase FemA/FemB family protein [Candidatus Saccharibacteria bacterium]|nr:peptidoglycan bridge formation glycyltransferase FemA/FemB family protein [Candidatus Saccharibacteria bacterium]